MVEPRGPESTPDYGEHQLSDAPAAAWRRLPFQLERQLRPHLCWAAIAGAVSQFYAPLRSWTQEELVTLAFHSGANKFWYADKALTVTGNYRSNVKRALTFAELEAEINQRRIVVARVWWEFGGGHLVALSGVSDRQEVAVEDPLYGPSEYGYQAFRDSYRGCGRWAQTYLTRPVDENDANAARR